LLEIEYYETRKFLILAQGWISILWKAKLFKQLHLGPQIENSSSLMTLGVLQFPLDIFSYAKRLV